MKARLLHFLSHSTVIICVALGLGGCPSLPQNAINHGPAGGGESERVIVTGSNIPTATEKHTFPWPPPKASAFDIIPRSVLTGNASHPTLSNVVGTLENALSAQDYYERSYYPVLDGFAVATHIEQINDDGTSKKTGRWSLEAPALETFSLHGYLRSLFRAPNGRYRVIVFVVTAHPFSQADAKVTRQQAKDWLSSGYNSLPDEIGQREFSPDYKCTALVYEFKGTGNQAIFVDPSEIQGRTHLEKSGLLAALARVNKPH